MDVRPWVKNVCREEAERWAMPGGAVCVSVTDPGSVPARLPRFDGVLRLSFSDWDPARGAPERVLGHSGPIVEFASDHAKRLAAFLAESRGKNMVVHCEAGVSRSAAIVEAVVASFPEYEDAGGVRFTNPYVRAHAVRALEAP